MCTRGRQCGAPAPVGGKGAAAGRGGEGLSIGGERLNPPKRKLVGKGAVGGTGVGAVGCRIMKKSNKSLLDCDDAVASPPSSTLVSPVRLSYF